MSEAGAGITEHPRCAGIRRDGQPCAAVVVLPSGWCLSHDPDAAAQRADARRRGGEGRGTARRLGKAVPARLRPTAEKLERALDDVLTGRLPAPQAQAAAAVARALIAVTQAGELAERLERLEREVDHAGRT